MKSINQELLAAFETKDFTAFFELIDTLLASLDKAFKKVILSLNKYKKGITNAMIYPYSNEKIEAKNTHIKTKNAYPTDLNHLRT